MIVVDTNVISELFRQHSVVAWMDAQSAPLLNTTAITAAEILFGLMVMPKCRKQLALKQAVETMFSALFIGRVLPFDRAAARDNADPAAERRQAGRPFRGADLQIAAIARARDATAIATRNTRDFADCGVPVVNPWVV